MSLCSPFTLLNEIMAQMIMDNNLEYKRILRVLVYLGNERTKRNYSNRRV